MPRPRSRRLWGTDAGASYRHAIVDVLNIGSWQRAKARVGQKDAPLARMRESLVSPPDTSVAGTFGGRQRLS
jgi:hypothetical protein